MEQLSLFEDVESPLRQRIRLFKDDKELLSLTADSLPEAQCLRRTLVERIQENPRSRIRWDDIPSPSGWWGTKPDYAAGAASVYCVIIEPIRGAESHE